MVENRRWLTVLSHAVLIGGVLVIAFPLYVTFVASTLTLEQIMQVPMPLVPGDQLVHNYSQVLGAGTTTGSKAAVWQDAGQQPGDGAGDPAGQDLDLDHLRVRDRLLPLSAAACSSSG